MQVMHLGVLREALCDPDGQFSGLSLASPLLALAALKQWMSQFPDYILTFQPLCSV